MVPRLARSSRKTARRLTYVEPGRNDATPLCHGDSDYLRAGRAGPQPTTHLSDGIRRSGYDDLDLPVREILCPSAQL